MKALHLKNKGENPVYEEFDLEPNPETVKVEMIASALNHRDLWIIKGQYAGLKYPIVVGSDGLGTYEGKRVIINPSHNWGENEKFQGIEYKILGLPDQGTMAEFCYVPEKYIYNAPEHLSNDEATALPLAGLTAFRALFVQGKAEKSQKVLISGIGGGVALFALQFAIANSMEVYVTSGSDEKLNKAEKLGATKTYNYNSETWEGELLKYSGGIDLVIDGAGGDGFHKFAKIMNPGGKIVIYGGTQGKINNLIPQTIFWKQISIIGSTMGSDSDFKNMLEFVNVHKIKPVIDSIFPIEDHALAFQRMDNGAQFGKIVMTI
jgi:zinc-binding alcohol dehydrogenase/oxidoreductase